MDNKTIRKKSWSDISMDTLTYIILIFDIRNAKKLKWIIKRKSMYSVNVGLLHDQVRPRRKTKNG